MPPPSFSDMVPFYKQVLGFTMELKISSSFKTTGLLQHGKHYQDILPKCLTTTQTPGIDGYSYYIIIKFISHKLSKTNRLLSIVQDKTYSASNLAIASFRSLPGNDKCYLVLHIYGRDQQYQLYLAYETDLNCQQQDIANMVDDPHDDAHPKGENSAKRQKTSEYEAYVSGESLSGQVFQEEQAPSTSGNQEQDDDFDFWTNSYALDNDEIPTKQVSHDIMEETTPLVHSCQKDPEAPALSLINQDLLYLKKGNSGPEKIVLVTSKVVPANPHAKIFYIRKQKEPGKPKEEVYSNSKIIQVVKTYWELGHEHKFITEIVARRANKYLVSITEPDYKNLNKNDIEDIYLLIMNGKKVNLTAPTKTFPGIEDHEMFSIIYEPVHGIIYKNSKKEKRLYV
ncbi:hypothetical protein Tco_0858730 [Tanacetum coccineum]|uniref:Uncharacterized protein n=1 Tax=Tanacetum coccineum TaxID=301880 RepID=A0ABQ5BDY5_9ASTR